MDLAAENAAVVVGAAPVGGRTHNNSTSAVTKQHAGCAVVPIENAGKGLRANDQRALGLAATEKIISKDDTYMQNIFK